MIYGDRVRQARELKGLTQAELAEAIGKDQSAVARIEAGEFQPTDDVLSTIALKLGLPPGFFKQPPGPDFPLGSLLFRAHATVTARERQNAYRKGEFAFQAVMRLLERMQPIPVLLPRVATDGPARAAQVTRSVMGLTPDRPIPNLVRAAERSGVLIIALPSLSRIDAFSAWVGVEAKRPIVMMASGKPGARLRLTIGHDLGHLVLHHTTHGKPSKQVESEAFAFSAELLMPAKAMHDEIVQPVTLTTIATLAPKWGVSIQALVRRAKDLNLITPRQYTYLFEQIGARGWRTNEPIFVPEEKPRAPRQMAELIYGTPLNYERIAADLNITPRLAKELMDAHAASVGLSPQVQPRSNVVPLSRSLTRRP